MNRNIFIILCCASSIVVTVGTSQGEPKNHALIEVPAHSEDIVDETSLDTEKEGSFINKRDEFIPTTEWKEIKPGQQIPKGLHVRINLETGLKEAKLLNPNEENSDTIDTKISQPRGSVDLEEALKNIATSHDEPNANKQDVVKQLEELKLQFDNTQGLEEIKANLKAKKIRITSETEMVQELTERLAHIARNTLSLQNDSSPYTESKFNHSGDSELLIILEDLQYLLHQIDNAQYFADIGGVAMLVNLAESVNITGEERLHVLLTLGNACSSNTVVSEAAQQANVFHLLQTILRGDGSGKASTDTKLRSRALYVLSNMVRSDLTGVIWRSFLVNHDGLQIIRSILREPLAQQKDVVKLYTLLYDVLQEQTLLDVFIEIDSESINRETLCEETSRIIAEYNHTLDHTEKLLDFIQSSLDTGFCNTSDYHAEQLQDLRSRLAIRFGDDEDRNYLVTVDTKIKTVLIKLYDSTSTKQHRSKDEF